MLVITIAGIMAAVAAPSFHEALINERIKTVSTDLHLSLLAARSEAVKRSADVDMVPDNSSSWLNGWKVKVDSSGTVLRTVDALSGVSLTCTNTGGSNGCSKITFERSGRPVTGTTVEFHVYPTDSTKVEMRCVSISLTGMPRVERDSDYNTANGCN